MVSTASPGTSFSAVSTGPISAEGFLVAMAVQQRALCPIAASGKRRVELARHEFLEQHGARRQPARFLGLQQRRDLVAEAEDAARLEPDHRDAARDIGLERRERALGLGARLLDQTDRQKRAAATQRPLRPVRRLRQMHAAAGGFEHGERGAEILRLEIAVEGVGEQHDFGGRRPSGVAAVIPEHVLAPRRELAPRAEAGVLLRHPRQHRHLSRRLASHGNRAAHGA